jgi:hypothetical protein
MVWQMFASILENILYPQNMVAVCPSEILPSIYQTALCPDPGDHDMNLHHKYLILHLFTFIFWDKNTFQSYVSTAVKRRICESATKIH